MGLVPKPLEINRLGRVWGGQSLGFGGRGTQKKGSQRGRRKTRRGERGAGEEPRAGESSWDL